MAYRLPPQPNLKHFKNQAKELVRDHHKGNLAAAQRIKENLPRLAGLNEKDLLAAEFSLQEAQHVLAREYGFAAWKQLLAFIEAKENPGPEIFSQEAIDALIAAHFKEEANAFSQEEIDDMTACFDEKDAFSQEERDTLVRMVKNSLEKKVTEAVKVQFRQWLADQADQKVEKSIWEWAQEQPLRSLSDLHYPAPHIGTQRLFTSALTEMLGHNVYLHGYSKVHKHSFHFIDKFLLPPPQYFYRFIVSPMDKPAYIHISKSIICCFLGIPYKSEEEAIAPGDLARLTPLAESLIDELGSSFSPLIKITCNSISLCTDVNELQVAEEDEYPISEQFIIKSARIRASLADRICLLFPRSVMEPILSLIS